MADPFSKVPNEIILEIAKFVNQADYVTVKYYNIGDMSHNPIVNFGMVCRRFREMSAHLLVTSVRVDCQTSSLQRLEEISHHPLVRKSVRELTVSLSFFSKELCDNFGQFIQFYAENLEEHCEERQYHPKRSCDKYWETKHVLESWVRIFEAEDSEPPHPDHVEEDAVHRTLLEQAYANYKQLHAEQEYI